MALTDTPHAHAARTTSKILLELEAVNFRPDEPYTHTSGRISPSYIDCRKLISFPRARAALMDLAVGRIIDEIGFERLDAIAGGETAGIPFAAWIAERLGLPMLYVRKEPKGFGRMAQIEGTFEPGARVLLVEDLTTDAASKKLFIDALRAAEAQVDDALVVFYYGIFPQAEKLLADLGVHLHALATWWDVLAAAREANAFPAETLDAVEAYLHDPDGWAAARAE